MIDKFVGDQGSKMLNFGEKQHVAELQVTVGG